MGPKSDQGRRRAGVLVGVGIFNRFEKVQPLNLVNLIGDSGAQAIWNTRLNSTQVIQNLVNFSLICTVGQSIGVTERLVCNNACVKTIVFSTGIFRRVLRAETSIIQSGLNSTKLIDVVTSVVNFSKGLVEKELSALLVIWRSPLDTGCGNYVGKSI